MYVYVMYDVIYVHCVCTRCVCVHTPVHHLYSLSLAIPSAKSKETEEFLFFFQHNKIVTHVFFCY